MKAIYDEIGTNYNRTRKADPFLCKRLLNYLSPKKEGLYLDIGCGTGNYTNALQREGYQFIGIDPSEKMLTKARSTNSNIEYRVGTAEHTGLAKNHIDGIIAFLTIHHWADLTKSFEELHRILKPQGKLVIFTSTPKQMKGYWLNHFFPKMLIDSINQMPHLVDILSALKLVGLKLLDTDKYSIKKDLKDQFLYCGKHNPELYFDQQIRQGISSFSSLANLIEVTQGLAKLRRSIDSGRISDVIDNYQNDFGDYLYIYCEKSYIPKG